MHSACENMQFAYDVAIPVLDASEVDGSELQIELI